MGVTSSLSDRDSCVVSKSTCISSQYKNEGKDFSRGFNILEGQGRGGVVMHNSSVGGVIYQLQFIYST